MAEKAMQIVPASPGDLTPEQKALLLKLVISNDLTKLTDPELWDYYLMKCAADRLDPKQQPYAFIRLQGKLTLYALKNATDQIRGRDRITIEIVQREISNNILTVEVKATDQSGRSESDIGAVSIAGLGGEALANAHMKAVTKAKRRATLAMGGVGVPDETEIETIPGATVVSMQGEIIDHETGEIVKPATNARATTRTTPPAAATATVSPAPTPPVAPDAPLSEATRRALYAAGKDALGWGADEVYALISATYNVADVWQLTDKQARALTKVFTDDPERARAKLADITGAKTRNEDLIAELNRMATEKEMADGALLLIAWRKFGVQSLADLSEAQLDELDQVLQLDESKLADVVLEAEEIAKQAQPKK